MAYVTREEFQQLERRFDAYKRASSALLGRLRALLPAEAEAAMRADFVHFPEEADDSEDPHDRDAMFGAIQFLWPDRD